MTDGLALFEDGLVVLEVRLGIVDDKGRIGRIRFAVVVPAAFVQEKSREVEVWRFPVSR